MKRGRLIALLLVLTALLTAFASCGALTKEETKVKRNFGTPARGADESLVAAEGSKNASLDALPEKTVADGVVTFAEGAFDGNVPLGEEYSGMTIDFTGVQLYGGEITLSGCENTVIANLSATNVVVFDPTCKSCALVNSRVGGVDDSSLDGALIVNNVITGGAGLNAPSIFRANTVGGAIVAEGESNVYIADCKIADAVTLTNCYNPVVVNCSAYGYTAENTRFATFSDDASEGAAEIALNGCKNALVTGCTGKNGDISVAQLDCEGVYGGNIPGVAMTAGCDETQLPQIDNSRFTGMERRDTVRDVDLKSLKVLEVPVKDYVLGHAAENATISVPAGAYSVPVETGEQYVLGFENAKDLRVDAYGALFEFSDFRSIAVAGQNCDGFELRGLTIDYAMVTNTQGTILKNGFEYVIWQADEGYPDNIDDPDYYPVTGQAESYRAGSDRPYADISCGDRIRQDDGTIRINGYFDMNEGDKIIFRGIFSHVNAFIECGGTSYEDVTVFGGSGFGFVEHGGDGGTTLNRVAFTPGPSPVEGGEARLISCCDATHTTCMRKGIQVTNCLFEKMTDDAANVNGTYGDVVSVDKDTKTMVYGTGTSNYGSVCAPFRVGDRVLVYTRDGGLVCDTTAKSESVALEGGGYSVTVDKAFSVAPGVTVVENASANGDGFLYENCIVQNNRSRGFLIKAPNGAIRNCTLRDNGMSAILVKPEISDGWGECGFSWNVTIENNVIERSGFFTGSELHSPINISSDREPTSDRSYMLHKDITVRGNVFRDRYTNFAINANGVDGLTIENNDFGTRIGEYENFAQPVINSLYGADDDEAYSVKLAGANNITVRGNTYPASGAGVLAEDTATDVKVEDR